MKLIYKILSLLFIFNTIKLNTNFFSSNTNYKEIKTLINRVYHKSEDIDRIEILIKNPKKCDYNYSIFNKYIYTLKIFIINDESYICNTIEDNNFDNLINKTLIILSKYNKII